MCLAMFENTSGHRGRSMNIEFLDQDITQLLIQRKLLSALVGVLALSNVLLVTWTLGKKEKIILIPPQLENPFWVSGETVSEEYLEDMGHFMAMLLLDISPGSFPFKHKVLLRHTTPEGYGALKSQLLKDGEYYTSLQLSTHFKPSKILTKPETLEAEVTGSLTSFVGDKRVRETTETLTFKFTMREGAFLLERASGGNPHAS